MTERMSDERLAEIRIIAEHEHAPSTMVHTVTQHFTMATRELLAEVKRLRANLALFGNVRLEWAVQHPMFVAELMDGPINASAACLQRNAMLVRERWTVVTRLVGEWREADRG